MIADITISSPLVSAVAVGCRVSPVVRRAVNPLDADKLFLYVLTQRGKTYNSVSIIRGLTAFFLGGDIMSYAGDKARAPTAACAACLWCSAWFVPVRGQASPPKKSPVVVVFEQVLLITNK